MNEQCSPNRRQPYKRFPVSRPAAWLRLGANGAARLLASLMLLLALPAAVQAIDYTYTTNNGMITITGYIGPGGAATIPDTIAGLPVTSIGGFAFQFCTSLTAITVDVGNLTANRAGQSEQIPPGDGPAKTI
jgi:hypothetical protein